MRTAAVSNLLTGSAFFALLLRIIQRAVSQTAGLKLKL